MAVLTAVILLLLVPSLAWAQCASASPGVGWVCQDGGWLPPGHPAIRPTVPSSTPSAPPSAIAFQPGTSLSTPRLLGANEPNAALVNAIMRGERLPAGDVPFVPPLVLTEPGRLHGHRTVLVPTSDAPGPLVIIHYMTSANLGQGVWTPPPPLVVSDVALRCSPRQTGIVVRAAHLHLERVIVAGCETGIRYEWAVNTSLKDSLIEGNRIGLDLAGYGSWGVSGPHSVTTLRISGTRIAVSDTAAIRVQHGLGILVSDNSILEYNRGAGILVQQGWPGAPIDVRIDRSTWFEANGVNFVDPIGAVRFGG